MTRSDIYILKGKCIISFSVALLLISIGLSSGEILSLKSVTFETTTIDIQQMAAVDVSLKEGNITEDKKLVEVKKSVEKKKEEENTTKVEVKTISNPKPEKVWYLPTEQGIITTYPSYGHAALDITSSRGSAEIIYPVANGTISSIYTDPAGALVVTVRHYVDGKYYSSQYAHLSRYANIYVGQNVTPYTPLGWMGTTGYSTGVHLHIAVVDCNMFAGTDQCYDINGYLNYAKQREANGFHGLGSLVSVPYQWYSR